MENIVAMKTVEESTLILRSAEGRLMILEYSADLEFFPLISLNLLNPQIILQSVELEVVDGKVVILEPENDVSLLDLNKEGFSKTELASTLIKTQKKQVSVTCDAKWLVSAGVGD